MDRVLVLRPLQDCLAAPVRCLLMAEWLEVGAPGHGTEARVKGRPGGWERSSRLVPLVASLWHTQMHSSMSRFGKQSLPAFGCQFTYQHKEHKVGALHVHSCHEDVKFMDISSMEFMKRIKIANHVLLFLI